MLVFITPFVFSCGGDDVVDDFQPEMELAPRPDGFKEFCEVFGLNDDVYNDLWSLSINDDKTVFSLANKNNSKLLVAIYDNKKKSIIYTNEDVSFSNSINTSYYEEILTLKVSRVYPLFAETKNGFIINTQVIYNESGDKNDISSKNMIIQNLYFFDGTITKTKQTPASSEYVGNIIAWYDNSCLLSKNTGNYSCYTDKGEELFADKYISIGERYILSYNEYINIIDSKYEFRRLDVLNPDKNGVKITNTVWSNDIKLIDNYSSDVKVTHTLEDRTTSEWSFSTKFVWENGTTKVVKWQLNIENGEYKIK